MAIEPAGEGQHCVIVSIPHKVLRRLSEDERDRHFEVPLELLVRHNDATGTIDVDMRPGPHGTWLPVELIEGVTVEVRNEGGVRDQWQHSA